MELIKLTGVSKYFAGVRALQNIDLVINEGEIRCLAGENGSGKSTLIKVLSGFYTPEEGTIEINGKVFERLTTNQAITEGIQVIYQDFSVFPNLTVAENIAIAKERLDNKKMVNWKNIRANAQRAIDMLGIDLDPEAILGGLPVASKQLVAICRAILQDAKLIIMDEPTTALTHKEVKALFDLSRRLQSNGISILFVSHKIEEVFEIAESITILRNGHKVAEGPMKDFDSKSFIHHMTGRTLAPNVFVPNITSKEPVMKVESIGLTDVFEDISFELYPGEIIAITGLLGSGRSEIARAMFGLEKITHGRILIDGKEVKPGSVPDAVKNGIVYVPEDRLTEGLFMSQSVSNNIASASIDQILVNGLINNSKLTEQADSWIERLHIVTPSGASPARNLSGGNQQRLVLSKWLATNPKVIILNGPTVGIDVGSKEDIHRITRDYASKGMGVIIISDDFPEVLENCSRVILLSKGRIADQRSCEGLTSETLRGMLIGYMEEVETA